MLPSSHNVCDRLGGAVVERSHRVMDAVGSIAGRVILNTLKLVVMAFLQWRPGLRR